MARIRTIKPEFFTSEDIVSMSPLARLLYIALWCEADRDGRLVWKPKTFKMRYFPGDSCNIEKLCEEVLDKGLVVVYEGRYAFIPTFHAHQHINPREAVSQLPSPDIDACTTRAPRDSDTPSRDSDTQVGREGKGREGKGREGIGFATPDGVSDSVWKDFRKIRAAKKSPITDTAMDGIRREADKAGYSLEKALATCCERGWTGFKADWVIAKDFKGQPITQALASDPESRASIEAEGMAKGVGAWDEGSEQWHVYKAKVRGNQRSLNISQLTSMAQRRVAA